jgi:hypothetical protein
MLSIDKELSDETINGQATYHYLVKITKDKLKDFLTKDAPDFDKEKKSFHWVASSRNHILPNSSQARQLAKSGIIVVGQLTL